MGVNEFCDCFVIIRVIIVFTLNFRMNVVKITSVVSFSHEETAFPASNLLQLETYKKWKCPSGTKQAIAILQLDSMHQIETIDIGNEGSAFIEILVGRSADTDAQFEVLAPTSTLMSPADSKAWTNCNAVKMFTKDKMNSVTVDQKWDRVKIVCHQSYNTTKPFGISFIRIRAAGASKTDVSALKKTDSLGQFKLKDDSSPILSPGSLFFEAKDKQESKQEISTAAKARDSCSSPVSAARGTKATTQDTKIGTKDKVGEKLADKPVVDVSHILTGVIFALSGFKNPLRAQIRDKTTKLGARYEGDWSDKCTHLICAFENTPKYKDVLKSKASCIVKPEWIDECKSSKKRVSAKPFLMAKIDEPTRSFPKSDSPKKSPLKDKPSHTHGSSTDELSDTEMDWQKSDDVTNNETNRPTDYNSAYDASTDEETSANKVETKVKLDLLNLPDFLERCVVFLYGDFLLSEQKIISRYVITYGGLVSEYMSDTVTHVISGSDWDDNFDKALSENSSLQFVRPAWLFACHAQQKLCPHQKYAIVPV